MRMKRYFSGLWSNDSSGPRPGLYAFGWLLATWPFGLRLNAMLAGLTVLGWLIERGWKRLHSATKMLPAVLAAGALFLWAATSILWSHNAQAARFAIEKSLGLLLLPAVLVSISAQPTDYRFLARHWLAGCALAVCAGLAASVYVGQPLFYHDFANVSGAHAGYLSMYVFGGVVLAFPPGKNASVLPKAARWIFGALAMLGLLLLSSKMFLALTALYGLAVGWGKLRVQKKWRWVPFAAVALLVGGALLLQPVRQRFDALRTGGAEVLTQEQFSWDTPLNGFNLRLLYWRLACDVLAQENTWLTGVGVGDDQQLLNERYRELGIFTGDPNRGDTGYLDYNFHNQFLQTTVQTGLVGLVLLIGLVVALLRAAHRTKYAAGFVLILSLLVFLLAESAFERQRGIFFVAMLIGLIASYRVAAIDNK